MSAEVTFLFYGTLNDFLIADRQYISFNYIIEGTRSVKDVIESVGVPHTEVDIIEVNGLSVDFSYLLAPGDNIQVYPVREGKQKINAPHLIEKITDVPAFVLDVHLGKLARNLRMLGFDALYSNSYTDKELTEIAVAENRVLLTRDIPLLKRKILKWGYWLRSQHPNQQLQEVITYFGLKEHIKPFFRCLDCNGLIASVEKEEILGRLLPNTIKYFDEYFICTSCHKIYWKGSHYDRMLQFVGQYCL
jgi:uncharacterized protein with PIN domain